MSDPAAKAEKQVRHLAIIMDGNGRWAERRNLPRTAGHRAGAETVRTTVNAIKEFGIKYLTLYAFSTENWKRSADEVGALMRLLQEFAVNQLPELMKEDVRLNVIGRISGLPLAARTSLELAMKKTRQNQSGTLTLALNYGGRAEIVDAVQKIAREVKNGKLQPETITEESFRDYLYDPTLPDPDLLIRTSGELRLSNFLLWELAYTEIFVTDTLWPDFNRETLLEALDAFQHRERRFGGRLNPAGSTPKKGSETC